VNNKTVRSKLSIYCNNTAFTSFTKGWALLIHLINKADAIQTGCEHFQERVEVFQEMFVILHKDQFNTLLQSKELIFTIPR